MATINLLTIHWGNSYGAVMQTMATCKILEEAGHTVTVINLIHPKIKKSYLRLNAYTYLLKDIQFLQFKHRFFSKMTKMMFCINPTDIPHADYTIVGSDQGWNCDITRPFAMSYFLDFVSEDSTRLALSASFGKSEWSEAKSITTLANENLRKFKAISIREKSGVEILKNTFGLQACQLIDPTLAYNGFKNIISRNKCKPQLFCFVLGGFKSTNKELPKLISKALGIKIYDDSFFKRRLCGGPMQWLDNIKNSRFIITNSFHGLAFCLMFHKSFIVICEDQKKFTRLESLLQLVHLEERYVKSTDDFMKRKGNLLSPINYNMVDVILKEEQQKFISFIKTNII